MFSNELKEHTFNRQCCATAGRRPGASAGVRQLYRAGRLFQHDSDFHAADIDVENGSDGLSSATGARANSKKRFCQPALFVRPVWGTTFIENHDQPRALSNSSATHYQTSVPKRWLRCNSLWSERCLFTGAESWDENFLPAVNCGI